VAEVPHRKQRYDTVGDWIPGTPVRIRVSAMDDKRYAFLVALHEILEYELCVMRGITDAQVVKFDKEFEAERAAGIHPQDAEPGEDIRAPYKNEHAFATMIERRVAEELGVKWSDYESAICNISGKRAMAVSALVDDGANPSR